MKKMTREEEEQSILEDLQERLDGVMDDIRESADAVVQGVGQVIEGIKDGADIVADSVADVLEDVGEALGIIAVDEVGDVLVGVAYKLNDPFLPPSGRAALLIRAMQQYLCS